MSSPAFSAREAVKAVEREKYEDNIYQLLQLFLYYYFFNYF